MFERSTTEQEGIFHSIRNLHPTHSGTHVPHDRSGLTGHMIGAVFVMMAFTFLATSLPFLLKRWSSPRRTSEYSRVFRIMNSWAGGAFLALGLFHLLPEAIELIEHEGYHFYMKGDVKFTLLAPILTFVGFALIFFLEQIICCHGECLENVKGAGIMDECGGCTDHGEIDVEKTLSTRRCGNSKCCEESDPKFSHFCDGCHSSTQCCGSSNHGSHVHDTDSKLRDSSRGFWPNGSSEKNADPADQSVFTSDNTRVGINLPHSMVLQSDTLATERKSSRTEGPIIHNQDDNISSNLRISLNSFLSLCKRFFFTSYCWISLGLIVHSVLEGIVVGTARTGGQVWMLTLLILGHKMAAGFALSTVLVKKKAQGDEGIVYVLLMLFIIASPIGIAAGACAVRAAGILTALSTGTVLYIACEIVLELHDRPSTPDKLGFRLIKFVCFLFGAGVVLAFTTVSQLVE